MRFNLILPGEQQFNEQRWRKDTMMECHYDDRLWAYACRVAEEIRVTEPGYFTDPVLSQLIRMGTYDWSGENDRSEPSMQAMRHSTVVASRLYRMHREAVSNVSVVRVSVEVRCTDSR